MLKLIRMHAHEDERFKDVSTKWVGGFPLLLFDRVGLNAMAYPAVRFDCLSTLIAAHPFSHAMKWTA
jgi:hypothetical protein